MANGFLLTGCSDLDNSDNCGDKKVYEVVLTAEDVESFQQSLPPGYSFYSWKTTIPSTNFSIGFNKIENICVESPVQISIEASCHQVPFEGDVFIKGIAGAGGGSQGYDVIFIKETTDEILFALDTVFELGTVDFMEEKPFFYTGVKFEVSTGGSQEDDMTYFYKVFDQIKITASYKASRAK